MPTKQYVPPGSQQRDMIMVAQRLAQYHPTLIASMQRRQARRPAPRGGSLDVLRAWLRRTLRR
ncbi:MAG TPA: hypothetical protein VK427_06785 [Kofleriaceae bacterium]|nr:hypothetical protein [Kofleriaceae bacterium]